MADDPYLWLEDIGGEAALDWVRERNSATAEEFTRPGDRTADFEAMRAEALEVLDTDTRIPYVRRRGGYLYNFWRDAANPRGVWRRTTLESYRTDDPDWDVVIDLDALADCSAAMVAALGGLKLHPEPPTSGSPGREFVDSAFETRARVLDGATR